MIFSRKNNMIRYIIWAIASAFALSLFFMSGNFLWELQRSSPAREDGTQDASPLSGIPRDERGLVLARAENWNITVGDFFSEYRRLDRRVKARYSDRDGREEFLNILIDRRLLTDAAEKMDISPDDEQITDFVADELSRQIGRTFTASQIQELFKSGLINKRDFYQQYAIQKLQERITSPVEYDQSKLESFYEENTDLFDVDGHIPPLDEITDLVMARKYYENHRIRWQKPDMLKVRHILLNPSSPDRRAQAADRVLPEDVRNHWEETKDMYRTPMMLNARHILIKHDSPALEKEIDDSEENLRAYYEKHQTRYLAPRRAEISHILFDPDSARWRDKATPDEEELLDYYNENFEDYSWEKQVRASHILVDSESEAMALLQQIDAGTAFEDAARENSMCPSSEDGGDLDFFSYHMMVSPFSEAAFNLEPGHISEPVETDFGWHIIKTTDVKAEGSKPFEEAREKIASLLKQEKAGRLAREHALKIRTSILDGADFAEVARRESDAKSRVSGGKIGWVYENTPPPGFNFSALNGEIAVHDYVDWRFKRSIFDTEPGRITQPINTELGIHLALVHRIEDERQLEYNEAREKVSSDFRKDAVQKAGINLAERLRGKLMTGETFHDLALQWSEGDSAAQGGELGWFSRGELPADHPDVNIELLDGEIASGRYLDSDIEKALFEKNIRTREPVIVRSSRGYHVIEIRNRRPSELKAFDEVRRQVREELIDFMADHICQSEGDRLLAILMVNQAKFEELATEHSDGVSREREGLMGWIPRSGPLEEDAGNLDWLDGELGSEGFTFHAGQFMMGFNLDNAISRVLMESGPGIIPTVIHSQFGYHIIRIDEVRKGGFTSFDDISSDIIELVNMKPPEHQIQEYWIDNLEHYREEARVNLRHIFVEPAGSSESAINEAKRRAEELRALVVNGESTFRQVAREHNSDYTRDADGELGWKTRGELSSALAKEAFSLEEGIISDVIRTPFGFHVIRVEEKQPERTRDLKEVRDEIEKILLNPLKNQVFEDYIEEIRRKASVTKELQNIDAFLMRYH